MNHRRRRMSQRRGKMGQEDVRKFEGAVWGLEKC
jgi:hypothetical protein